MKLTEIASCPNTPLSDSQLGSIIQICSKVDKNDFFKDFVNIRLLEICENDAKILKNGIRMPSNRWNGMLAIQVELAFYFEFFNW